jgi:hypothetical protein
MILAEAAIFLVVLAGVALVLIEVRRRHISIWLGSDLRQDWRAPAAEGVTKHLLFAFVDHFEPRFERPSYEIECSRVARWRKDYERLCQGRRDADGRGPIHTFFYPEEEYRPEHLDPLVELCRLGIGEIEIHLHHDNDTSAGFREKLRRFTRQLVERHDALPCDAKTGQPRWAFIHGNWALDNSMPDGSVCGVNDELQILREEGCYADFTLPSAPSPCQTTTINDIYYATDDPHAPKSHDDGEQVRVGGAPAGDLMIIQGPLGFMWRNRKLGIVPRIDNADVRTSNPPTPDRIDAWVKTGIHVKGRPEWIFVKVHTHGAPERDVELLLGEPMRRAFEYLETRYNDGRQWKLHYVSAREMANLVVAAEDGAAGEPGALRDHVVRRPPICG